ncbi:MAG: hypothetical protein AAB539_01810 [Patescibacteria group bacterium]
MKILLVDDNARHRRAGIKDLEALGHKVIAISDYWSALDYARNPGNERFDAAILDLLMPAEPTTLSPQAITEYLGREIAVGFPLILKLSQYGIRRIAVATDTNHHQHPMSAIVDWFQDGQPITANGAKVLIMHAPPRSDGTKAWDEILNRLFKD